MKPFAVAISVVAETPNGYVVVAELGWKCEGRSHTTSKLESICDMLGIMMYTRGAVHT